MVRPQPVAERTQNRAPLVGLLAFALVDVPLFEEVATLRAFNALRLVVCTHPSLRVVSLQASRTDELKEEMLFKDRQPTSMSASFC